MPDENQQASQPAAKSEAPQSTPPAAARDPKADVEVRIELKAIPPEKWHLIQGLDEPK